MEAEGGETTAASSAQPPQPSARRSRWGHRLYVTAVVLLGYLLMAYVAAPLLWRTAIDADPRLGGGPRVTHTANGIPGDPVNIALVGSKSDVIQSMIKARWFPANPITFDSSVRIAVDSVFDRPDDEAPVSSLYLFGRKEDLAFEQPVGDSPRQRHHVRFWLWDKLENDRPVWFGAATFDERVGLSHTTGQVTHHIGPDVDAERDRIIAELRRAGEVQDVVWKDHFHKELEGRNGGGDPWHTDGRLAVVVFAAKPEAALLSSRSSNP
ncbi:MAG TPA: LssY C-terminal domain-containing protein [Candidatus Binatia bacterium]|nr:LssY C-terminal domain-containing protein [Candidatus Binatia bacterium]